MANRFGIILLVLVVGCTHNKTTKRDLNFGNNASISLGIGNQSLTNSDLELNKAIDAEKDPMIKARLESVKRDHETIRGTLKTGATEIDGLKKKNQALQDKVRDLEGDRDKGFYSNLNWMILIGIIFVVAGIGMSLIGTKIGVPMVWGGDVSIMGGVMIGTCLIIQSIGPWKVIAGAIFTGFGVLIVGWYLFRALRKKNLEQIRCTFQKVVETTPVDELKSGITDPTAIETIDRTAAKEPQ
jgi:hypothetical protein